MMLPPHILRRGIMTFHWSTEIITISCNLYQVYMFGDGFPDWVGRQPQRELPIYYVGHFPLKTA